MLCGFHDFEKRFSVLAERGRSKGLSFLSLIDKAWKLPLPWPEVLLEKMMQYLMRFKLSCLRSRASGVGEEMFQGHRIN